MLAQPACVSVSTNIGMYYMQHKVVIYSIYYVSSTCVCLCQHQYRHVLYAAQGSYIQYILCQLNLRVSVSTMPNP